MTQPASKIVVLGDGPYARTLAGILRGQQIVREQEDCDWRWVSGGDEDQRTMILIAAPDMSASRVIHLLWDAWRCPGMRQARVLIFTLEPRLVNELESRDIFGRLGRHNDSIADWSNNIGVSATQDGLAGLIAKLTKLKALPLSTWLRKATEASVIPAITAAIQARDMQSLLATLERAKAQDWDSICPNSIEFQGHHQYAKCIRDWLRAVTPDVTPDWVEGQKLFSPLRVG